MVRVGYIIPSDRTPQADAIPNLRYGIATTQAWFRDQMARYGFGGKTFRYETESDGITPRIWTFNVSESAGYLRGNGNGDPQAFSRIVSAAQKAGCSIWANGEVWLLVAEVVQQSPDGSYLWLMPVGARNEGDTSLGIAGGVALVDNGIIPKLSAAALTDDRPVKGMIIPGIGPYPMLQPIRQDGTTLSQLSSSHFGAMIHELGHAFGLPHDMRNDRTFHGNLMGAGFGGLRGNLFPTRYPHDDVDLTQTAARVLSVSGYFGGPREEDVPPTSSFLTSGTVDANNGSVEIAFSAEDAGGLALATLLLDYQHIADLPLSGTKVTSGFLTSTFHPGAKNDYTLFVFDRSGNKRRASVSVTVITPPAITRQPSDQVVSAGASTMLAITATTGASFQWQKNGRDISGCTSATLVLANLQPADTGLYAAVAANGTAVVTSNPAIVGLSTTAKVTGSGTEVLSNQYVAKNSNTFDQVLLEGAAATITADYSPDPARNQITRMSYIDLDGDIVQVEFSGPGTLSLVLGELSPPALPENYNQAVHYVKGHAGIIITGATERTNVSVFTVGRATAVNQSLFKDNIQYDGIADIAFIAIMSANGKFGGVRTANANYFAHRGYTGIYAPGVEFTGPVFAGDTTAFDSAKPVLVLGSATDTRITGGDLYQDNSQPVQVSGIAQLRFTAGADSHGRELLAQTNRAVLQQNGQDVTSQIAVNP